MIYLNRVGGEEAVSLRERQSDAHAVPYERYAVGVHHVAFGVTSRAVVDERARWLIDHGASIESGPCEYQYTPGYYAVFFYDPDGIKLELVHRPAERDLATALEELSRRVAQLEDGAQ